jgi:hypothetical protein
MLKGLKIKNAILPDSVRRLFSSIFGEFSGRPIRLGRVKFRVTPFDVKKVRAGDNFQVLFQLG